MEQKQHKFSVDAKELRSPRIYNQIIIRTVDNLSFTIQKSLTQPAFVLSMSLFLLAASNMTLLAKSGQDE